MPETHEIIISARNDTKKAFNEMERQARQATERMERQFKGLTDTMFKAGAGLTAMGVAGGAFIASSTMLAARVETLGVVVEQVGKTAGYSAEQMHGFVQGVEDTGITTQAARTAVIKLTQAQIDLGKSSDLARIAQDAAVIAGIDSSEAFTRMIHGITTLNPLILRKMGILVNLQQEYKKTAAATDRATTDLTAMEKQQIAMNAVMKAAEGIAGSYEAAMGTAGKQITSLPRHIEQARKAIGEAWLPVMSAAVVAVTDLLKSFNNMEPSAKRFISLFMGMGSAVTLMIGPMLILASKLPVIVGGLTKVGLAIEQLIISQIAMTGTTGAATTAVLGLSPALVALATAAIVAVAIMAVVAALAKLLEFSQDVAAMTKLVDDALVEHEQHMRDTSESYREYADEMDRALGVAKRVGMTQAEYNKELERLKKTGMAAGKAIQSLRNVVILESDAERKSRKEREHGNTIMEMRAELMRSMVPDLEDRAKALEALAEAEKEAAEKAELLRQIWHGQINELMWLSGIDITEMIEDHNASQYRLNQTVEDAVQELADLTKEYQQGKIAKKDYLEQADLLEKKILASKKAVEQESEAWLENRRQMLFNMAQRAIMESGLDPETQFEAIAGLMEAFDMIDPATAALWNAMGIAVGDLVAQTTDVEGFKDVVLELVPLMDNRKAVWEWEFRTTGEFPSAPPRSGREVLIPWEPTTPPPGGVATEGPGGPQEFQHGGSVERGQPVIPHAGELFIPDTAGRIYSAAELARLASGSAEAGGDGEAAMLLKQILAVLKEKELAPQFLFADNRTDNDDDYDRAYELFRTLREERKR